MSDDLVKRLYDRRVCSPAQNSCRNDLVLDQAAERIEELEALVGAQTAELRKMERAVRWIGYKSPMIDALPATMQKHARAALAELKGQGDE